jgi:alkaline phosphatase D
MTRREAIKLAGAPDIAFADVAGHGYAVVRADARTLRVEFVCIPRPIERSARADGGPILYRITHRADLWSAAQGPRLTRTVHQGSLPLGTVNRSQRFGSES